MAQRADPVRVYEAQRLGVRKRLVARGIGQASVDRWMEAWEATGARPPKSTSGDFWTRGADWIIEEHEAGQKPPAVARAQLTARG